MLRRVRGRRPKSGDFVAVAKADGDFEIIHWPSRNGPPKRLPSRYTEAELWALGIDPWAWLGNGTPNREFAASLLARSLDRDRMNAVLFQLGYLKPESVEHNPFSDIGYKKQEWWKLERIAWQLGLKPGPMVYITPEPAKPVFSAFELFWRSILLLVLAALFISQFQRF